MVKVEDHLYCLHRVRHTAAEHVGTDATSLSGYIFLTVQSAQQACDACVNTESAVDQPKM